MKQRERPQAGATEPPVEEMQEQLGEIEDDQKLRRMLRRRQLRKYRWVVWLLLMLPVVYLAVQIFIILAPRMRTEVALLDTMTDSIEVHGQAVFESEVVGGGGGHIYYLVPAGQRVAAGAEVALVFASEKGVETMDRIRAIEQELEILTEAQGTTAEGGDLEIFLAQQQQGLYQLLAGLETGDYANLDEAKYQMVLAANKMQIVTGEAGSFEERINTLAAQKTQLEAALNPTATVTAPAAGYFVPSPASDRIPLGYEELAGMTASQLEEALLGPAQTYPSDVAGHIVTSYAWHFFTTVEARLADRFVVGDKSLQLVFPEVSDKAIPVTVEAVTVDEANDSLALIELKCEYIGPEILGLRAEKAEIVFGTVKGLRIEKTALRLVNMPNDDGSVTTYRGVYVEFGNMVYFRRVEILLEDDFYMLVPSEVTDGVNEVKLYDTVVVDSGGVELYDRKIL